MSPPADHALPVNHRIISFETRGNIGILPPRTLKGTLNLLVHCIVGVVGVALLKVSPTSKNQFRFLPRNKPQNKYLSWDQYFTSVKSSKGVLDLTPFVIVLRISKLRRPLQCPHEAYLNLWDSSVLLSGGDQLHSVHLRADLRSIPFMLAKKRLGMLCLFVSCTTQTVHAITSYSCALPSFPQSIRAHCLEP